MEYDPLPDNVYVNVNFQSANPIYQLTPSFTSLNNAPVDLDYNVTKSSNVVELASEYYVSLIRASLPLTTIPEFICPIVPNQSNPRLTPFVIGINYGVGHLPKFPVNLIFGGSINNETPPVQDRPYQVVTPALFVFNFQAFVTMLNIALLTAYSNAGLGTLFPLINPPYFFFDPLTQTINLVAPSFFTYPGSSPAIDIPTIFINNQLRQYLVGFNYFFNGYSNLQNDDWYFNLYTLSTPGTSNAYPTPEQAYSPPAIPITNPPTYFLYRQQYSTTQLITAARNVIITTNTIPINKENQPSLSSPNGQNNLLPIIFDLSIDLLNIGDNRNVEFYEPTTQYRLVDLLSPSRINQLDFRIFWQDLYGNYWPLQLDPLQQASIKIAFVKKSLYKSSNVHKM